MPRAAKIECLSCLKSSEDISDVIRFCADCIKNYPEKAFSRINNVRRAIRSQIDLPEKPAADSGGINCMVCMNQCSLGDGQTGFCGLREMANGKLIHKGGTKKKGIVSWYKDPLPTNCVASWVCEGYDQRGSHNLAVFYKACSMDCLFCQNWHFRQTDPEKENSVTSEELAEAASQSTFCVCYFGGDPSPQMPHALGASRILAEKGIRICWETNGMMGQKYMDEAVNHSLTSGGCIKFDLKAFNTKLHKVLTGIPNTPVLNNFSRAAERFSERPENPLVIASTLLVPGYIERDEVSNIAKFIASVNPDIPYSLLAFAPQFYMSDMPFTSARQAKAAEDAACDAGLQNVHIGNRHLLGL